MKRTVQKLIQGSPEWLEYRAKHFNASDCPAMLGISKYKSRDALLKEIATGVRSEVDSRTQHIFDRGHAFESAYRPLAAEIVGDELYQSTISLELDGLSLSASFDGITMDDSVIWEHKTLNAGIEAAIRLGDEIPEQYRAQMEMQMLVGGATRCLFSASTWTTENRSDEEGNVFLVAVDMIDHIDKWYEQDLVLQARIISGWKQFAIDLANYVLPEADAPKAIAEPVATLPAITYQTTNTSKGLELASNLDIYKEAAQKLVEQSKKKLETDQDFANAEARIKACKEAEERIAVIQSNVIGEVADIDKFVKDLGAISEMLRQCRLNEDKQVKDRKEKIRIEIVNEAMTQWNAHLNLINEKLDSVKLPAISIDLVQAIKGKKTVASLRSAANDELARAKIEANALAEKITYNIQLLRMIAGEYMELFADLQTICVKDADYIKAIAKQRVDEHKAAEQARIQAEAQRIANEQIEKDRQAELAKAQAAAVQAIQPLEAEVKPVREQQLDLVDSIPAEYEQYASQTKSFDESFNSVFNDEPEPIVDLSEFQKGRALGEREGIIKGLDLALMIFIKHGAAGFAKAVEDFIEVGAPETEQAEAA